MYIASVKESSRSFERNHFTPYSVKGNIFIHHQNHAISEAVDSKKLYEIHDFGIIPKQ